ncbi:hypothetical protein [Streptomyces spectabilis]|uniref:Uncharacterized protein n=1 Tax=Streptomyces spectabilis TaxID=68270 RepID=A0A516R1G0_STRST|nr:hypothetical protein [Streptomyces spectabilis]QDQ09486.1 hypothetical protein FH965_02025 [Streptomyces spectabilis]
MGAPDEDRERSGIDNDISGHVTGPVGQFGNVFGDVHFHEPSAPKDATDTGAGASTARSRPRRPRREPGPAQSCGCAITHAASGLAITFAATGHWTYAAICVGVLLVLSTLRKLGL